jgi:hypothetical protein
VGRDLDWSAPLCLAAPQKVREEEERAAVKRARQPLSTKLVNERNMNAKSANKFDEIETSQLVP